MFLICISHLFQLCSKKIQSFICVFPLHRMSSNSILEVLFFVSVNCVDSLYSSSETMDTLLLLTLNLILIFPNCTK